VQLVAADRWTGAGATPLSLAVLLHRRSDEPARFRQTGEGVAQRARALGTLRLPAAAALDLESRVDFLVC